MAGEVSVVQERSCAQVGDVTDNNKQNFEPGLTSWAAAISRRPAIPGALHWWLITTGIAGLALCLRTQQLTAVSFWFDEACSWRISQFPWAEMHDAISRDAHPPLFYVLQKCWQYFAGTSVLSARGLSVLFGIGSIAAAGWLGAVIQKSQLRTHSEPHASSNSHNEGVASHPTSSPLRLLYSSSVSLPIMAALLVCLSPLQVELSQQARPYQLGVLLLLACATFLLRAISISDSWTDWGGFSLCALGLSWTHYFGLFSLIALFLFAVCEVALQRRSKENSRRNQQTLCGLLISAGAIQICWWPWLATFQSQRLRTDSQFWLGPLQHADLFDTVTTSLSGIGNLPATMGWIAAVIWIVVPLTLLIWCGTAGRMIALCIAVPWLLSLTYSLCVRNILEPRYLVFAQAALLVGIAMLITTVCPARLRSLALLAVVGCLSWWCQSYSQQRDSHARHAGLKSAVEHLDQQRTSDEPVFVSSPFVYVSVLLCSQHPGLMKLSYNGDHRHDVLGGPPLKTQDYQPLQTMLTRLPEKIWTIDVEHLWGQNQNVPVPARYRPASQIRFTESFGIPMHILVRSYELTNATHTGQQESLNTGDQMDRKIVRKP